MDHQKFIKKNNFVSMFYILYMPKPLWNKHYVQVHWFINFWVSATDANHNKFPMHNIFIKMLLVIPSPVAWLTTVHHVD